MKRAVWLWLCAGVTLLGWQRGSLVAQDIHTLHVYADTMQIPVLVLEANRDRVVKPIAGRRFWVSFASGPWYQVAHVRQEGDDPISLSILLDVRGAPELMPKIEDAIASMAPLSLMPRDHVTVYVLNCDLSRSAVDVPADKVKLKDQVEAALEPWRESKKDKHAAACKPSIGIWDALAYMSQELSSLPGRRVILAVTDGRDSDTKNVRQTQDVMFVEGAAVAVFGIGYVPWVPTGTRVVTTPNVSEIQFQQMCEVTGGTAWWSSGIEIRGTLKHFTTALRERYIIEFPRPAKIEAGRYEMKVKIDKGNYFVTASGITVPLPDAAVLADPNTIKSDPSRTPEVGKQPAITKPN